MYLSTLMMGTQSPEAPQKMLSEMKTRYRNIQTGVSADDLTRSNAQARGWTMRPTRKSLTESEIMKRFVGVSSDGVLSMPAIKQ